MMREKSPWTTAWVEPQATIRKIVAENPKRSLWLLAAIYGFSSILNSFQSAALGTSFRFVALIIAALLLAPFWGYAVFGVWSWMICWTGKLFKGVGNFQHVRAAYAWSCVPLAVNAFLWILMLAIFGAPLFRTVPEQQTFTDGQASLLLCILIGKVILAIWSLVIYLNMLSAVQAYSILKAIGNVIVAGILVTILFGILWAVGMYLLGIALSHAAPMGSQILVNLQHIIGGV